MISPLDGQQLLGGVHLNFGTFAKASIAACFASSIAAGETVERQYQIAMENLGVLLDMKYAKSLEERLGKSGIDPAEAERIIFDLFFGYSQCIVEKLQDDSDPRAAKLFSMVLAGPNQAGAALAALGQKQDPDDEAWALATKVAIETCLHTVDQEAGFSVSQLDTT